MEMNTVLAEALAANDPRFAVGEYRGAEGIEDFGDPQSELLALRENCAVYDLGYRVRLSLTGADRVRWLNGMVTNNIRDLAAGRGVYAFLLNPQGHILGDLYAFNFGDSITVDTDRSQRDKVLATFDHYIIMDDVEVSDLSAGISAIGVAGPRSRTILESLGFEIAGMRALEIRDQSWRGIDCTLVCGEREDHPSFEIWLPNIHIRTLWDATCSAGATPVGFRALELQRIALGIPLYGVDIRERDLPQETEQARALNFNKGCYVGQEIIERIRSRGAVHRKFSGFAIEGSADLAPTTRILANDKEVGEITSIATYRISGQSRTIALGYIRREVATPGRQVGLGNNVANVISLPVPDSFLRESAVAERRA